MQKKTREELCSELKQLVIDHNYFVILPSVMQFLWRTREYDVCCVAKIQTLLIVPQENTEDENGEALKLVGVDGREVWDICYYAGENDLLKLIRTIKNEPEPTRDVWVTVLIKIDENRMPDCEVKLFSKPKNAQDYLDSVAINGSTEAKNIFKITCPADLMEGYLVFELFKSKKTEMAIQPIGTSCEPTNARNCYNNMRDELLEDYKEVTDGDEGFGRFITQHNEEKTKFIAGYSLSDETDYVDFHYVFKTTMELAELR